MTCPRCKGHGEVYCERFVSEGDTEGGFDRCAPCAGTGEVRCECGRPADGVVAGIPACVVCIAGALVVVDQAALVRP